jgi:hypothetical protein
LREYLDPLRETFLFRNTHGPHPETSGILTASPEPLAAASGTISQPYGPRFRPIRPNRPHRQPNMLISHYNFLLLHPAHIRYLIYYIIYFSRLTAHPQKDEKDAPNKKGTGFPTGENLAPFQLVGRENAAPPAFRVVSLINHFKILHTVPIMEATITIITAKNRFTNIIVNISEPG